MKTTDIIFNTILSLLVIISADYLSQTTNLNSEVLVIISFLLIALFWLLSWIKEIKQTTENHKQKLRKNLWDIEQIKKDLNIDRRLTILESWRENMEKRGKKAQIDIGDIIKIAAIIILTYLIFKYATS